MSFNLPVYVCFDADSDIHYYRLMQAWKQSDNHSFDFRDSHDVNNIRSWSSEETIKLRLRERLKVSKVFLVLVGEKTKFLYKYVRWEIEQAVSLNVPIICVNLNGRRGIDDDRCPPILKGKLALHISFNTKILQKALQDWSIQHYTNQQNGKTGDFSYSDNVYTQLGL